MSKQWFEDSKLWKDISPFIFSAASHLVAHHEIHQLIELINSYKSLELNETSQVLDLGCGPGRHSIPLLELAYSVDALDLTEDYLNDLAIKAESLDGNLKLILQDMRKPLEAERYDLVLCLFTSFGYFEDWSDNLHLIKNVYQSLKTKAYFVIEVTSPNNFDSNADGVGQRKRQVSETESLMEVWKVYRDQGHSRVQNDWTFIGKAKAKRFKFDHWLFKREELESLMIEAGFQNLHFYSDYFGTPYNSESTSMLLVAQK